MGLGTRLIKNTGYLTIGNQAGNILQFVFFVFFARQFGEATLGKYSFAFSFTFIASIFADLGLSAYMIREVAIDRSGTRQLFAQCLILRVLGLIIATVVAVGIVLIFSSHFSNDTVAIIVLLGLYHIFFGIADIYLGEFKGHDRMGLVAVIDIFLKLIIASLGILLIFLGYGFFTVLACFPVASFLYLILSMFLSAFYFGLPKVGYVSLNLKSLFVTVLPFAFTLLFAHALYHQDILVLRLLQSDEAVGFFTAGNRIVLAFMGVLVFVHTALLPTFSRLYVESKPDLVRLSNQALRYLLIIGLPLGIGLFAVSGKIVVLLFSSSFERSIDVLKILSWTLILGFAATTFSVLLTAINRQKEKVCVLGICLLVNLLLNLVLIGKWSYTGAAVAKLFTEGLHLFLMAFLSAKYLALLSIHRVITKPIIGCLLMYIFILIFYQWNLVFLVFCSALIYSGSLLAMRAYNDAELEVVKRFFAKTFSSPKLTKICGLRK